MQPNTRWGKTFLQIYEELNKVIRQVIIKISDIIEALSQPLSRTINDYIFEDIPIINDIILFIVDTLNIGGYSILELIFSLGIITIILFSIIKFFKLNN